MNGQVLSEIEANGTKRRTFVYANGAVLAWHTYHGIYPGVMWVHRDASNASFYTTNSLGSITIGGPIEELPAELNPLGANVGLTGPPPQPPSAEGNSTLMPYPAFGNPGQPGTSYTVDGIPVDPNVLLAFVASQFHGSLGLLANSAVESARVIGMEEVKPRDEDIAWDGDIGYYTARVKITFSDKGWGAVSSFLSGSFPTQQNPTVKSDNPNQLQSPKNGPACGIEVNFKPGTTYPNTNLPNGPGTLQHPDGSQVYGLGFTVTGWVTGGIGKIGGDEKPENERINPHNPKGTWTLDQQSNRWTNDGQGYKKTWSDISTTLLAMDVAGDNFRYYDHPGTIGAVNVYGIVRYQNFIVKVYKGKTVCEVKFHFIQNGTTFSWGEGTL